MKRVFFTVLLLAGLTSTGAQAQTNLPNLPNLCREIGEVTSPFALFFVDDLCVDLSDAVTSAGKLWTLSVNNLVLGPAMIQSLSATFNPDPFITFGVSTVNVMASPVTYAFLFGTPVVPDFYTAALSTAGVSLTSGASGMATVDNSALHPTYLSGYGTFGVVPTNLGVDLGTAPCSAGPGAPAGDTEVCDYNAATNSFPPAFYNNLEALLTYTQSDVGSVASWSGSVVLTQPGPQTTVPEPATMALLGTGLAALAAVARRRSRKQAEELA